MRIERAYSDGIICACEVGDEDTAADEIVHGAAFQAAGSIYFLEVEHSTRGWELWRVETISLIPYLLLTVRITPEAADAEIRRERA